MYKQRNSLDLKLDTSLLDNNGSYTITVNVRNALNKGLTATKVVKFVQNCTLGVELYHGSQLLGFQVWISSYFFYFYIWRYDIVFFTSCPTDPLTIIELDKVSLGCLGKVCDMENRQYLGLNNDTHSHRGRTRSQYFPPSLSRLKHVLCLEIFWWCLSFHGVKDFSKDKIEIDMSNFVWGRLANKLVAFNEKYLQSLCFLLTFDLSKQFYHRLVIHISNYLDPGILCWRHIIFRYRYFMLTSYFRHVGQDVETFLTHGFLVGNLVGRWWQILVKARVCMCLFRDGNSKWLINIKFHTNQYKHISFKKRKGMRSEKS